ncbi:NAD(P)H-binding protein [Streptomyces sp. NBC_01022]|uniref:NAD(P)H-binding protein n=1 Tax=Streptomyces sp. NBC_01022 TaxID=2903723 RepID=UPI002DD8776C|nr:NAD(P)H-binding protein [Streptomyces sp. NBC_01022]WRZ87580.1 NAD(P)H-binding protein [Streptomyces sp. NBC_01022]
MRTLSWGDVAEEDPLLASPAGRTSEAPGRPLRIAVTGASGTVGALVTRMLAGRYAVTAVSRDPARAARGGVAGTIVGADFAERRDLSRALAGADAVLAVTFDPLRPTHDANILAAARREGVRHVVKLSALAVTDPDAQDVITRWQRESEEQLKASGLAWTILRPRAFMSNTLDWAPSVRGQGVVRGLYGTSRNSCVDPRDVAEAAACALSMPGHDGRIYALTGPQALSVREQTEQLGRALGRALTYEELTEEQALQAWRRRHPEPVAQAILDTARRQRDGAKTLLADGVREVTGHAPAAFRTWAERHAGLFRGAGPGGPARHSACVEAGSVTTPGSRWTGPVQAGRGEYFECHGHRGSEKVHY